MKHRNAVAISIAIALAACGGNGSPTGASAVDPASSTVVLRQTVENVEAGGQRTIGFEIPRRGLFGLTVRWNDPTHSVVAALTRTGCPDCPTRRSFDRQGREGREAFLSGFSAGGTYQLRLKNQGRDTESISVIAELF
jgi:hypothetical protein